MTDLIFFGIWLVCLLGFAGLCGLAASILNALGRIEQKLSVLVDIEEQRGA